MKKLLLLALSVLAVATSWAYDRPGTELAPPVTALTDGHYYYIYDAQGDDGTATERPADNAIRYAFRGVTGTLVGSTHIKPINEFNATNKSLTHNHIWKAVKEGDNWKFQNLGNSQWFSNTRNTSATAAVLVLEPTATAGTFKVRVNGTTNSRWDGNPNDFVYWNGGGHPINFYEAIDAGAGYNFATTGASGSWIVTYHYPNNSSSVKELRDGANAANAAYYTSKSFVTLGLSESNTTVSETNKDFHVIATATDLPFRVSESTDNLIWQPLLLNPNSSLALTYEPGNSTSNVRCVDPTGPVGFNDNRLWAFVGDVFNGFKIYCKATGTAKALKAGSTYASLEDAAGATNWMLYTSPVTSGDKKLFALRALFGSNNNYINLQSGFPKNWSGVDAGSSLWVNMALAKPVIDYVDATFPDKSIIEGLEAAYNACVADPNDEAKLNTLKALAGSIGAVMIPIREKGNAMAALGFFNDLAVARWNEAAAEKTEYTTADLAAIKNAYVALIHSTCSPDSVVKANCYIRIKHAGNQTGAYIGLEGTLPTTRVANAGTSAFRIIPVSTGGFKLFNEAANAYLQMVRVDSQTQTFTTNEANATVMVIEPYGDNPLATNILLKGLGMTDANNRYYLHSNGSSKLVSWSAVGSALQSSWLLESCDPVVAAKENLQAAINVCTAHSNYTTYVGSGVGQYTPTSLDPIRALLTNDAATEAQVRQPIASLRDGSYVVQTQFINMPVQGHFYRLKSVGSTKYMSSETAERINLVANKTGDNEAKTIFYIDAQNRLVAYPSGYVIGKFIGGETTVCWKFLRADNAKAATGVQFIAASGEIGKFYVNPYNDRRIYGGTASSHTVVDCGGNHPTGAGYQWILEDVTWLPVSCGADGITTFYSPVELILNEGFGAGRFKAYAVSEVLNTSGSVVLEQLNSVPANTPVLMVRNGNDNFLEINYANPTAAPATNLLTGNILAAAKTSGTNYMIAGKVNNKNTLINNPNSENPGFGAYIPLTTAPLAKYRICLTPFIPGKLYTITSTDGRGSLIHRPENGTNLWTTGKANVALNPNDNNHLWAVYIDDNDSTYLVNAGIKKFANAYDTPCTQHDKVLTNWGFHDMGSAVRMPEGTLTNVRILGGDYASTGVTTPGMMIINGWPKPVPCISGVGDANDGNHFNFAVTGNASAELWRDIETLYANQATVLANATAYPYESYTAADGDEAAFGEYPYTLRSDFQAALPSTSLSMDRRYRDAPAAIAAFNNNLPARSNFVDGQIYDISDASGNFFHFRIAKGCASDVVTAEAIPVGLVSENSNLNKWYCEVTDGNVALFQTWNNSIYYAQGTGKRYFNYPTEGDNRFNVTLHPTEGGKALLTPVASDQVAAQAEGEAPSYFNIAKVTNTNGSITTDIFDLRAEGDASDVSPCFDLQGRRIVRPAHGIYIQGGSTRIAR